MSHLEPLAGFPEVGRQQPPTARDDRTGLYYRPDTVDLDILRGDARSYTKRLEVGPGARVLDIGAHIGGATAEFVRAGAELVVAVEADPDNFALLERNCPERHVAIHAAAVGDDAEYATLWRNTARRSTANGQKVIRGTTLHSLTQFEGRQPTKVPARNITKLTNEYAITHVKLDAEGAEYDLLRAPLAAPIRRLMVEFHGTHQDWMRQLPETIIWLRGQGFVPDKSPERPTDTAWVWTVAWRR